MKLWDFNNAWWLILVIVVLSLLFVNYGVMKERIDAKVGNDAIREEPMPLLEIKLLSNDEVGIQLIPQDNYGGIFEVEKWEGEDSIFVIPMYSPDYHPYEWVNILTILDGDGVLYQYEVGQDDARILDVYLDRDMITALVVNKDESGGIYEFDYQGNILRALYISNISHQAEPTDDGYLIINPKYEQAAEIDRNGNILWRWSPKEAIVDYSDANFLGLSLIAEYGDKMTNMYSSYRQLWDDGYEYTHINSVQKLSNDNYLVGLRNLDLIVEVNPDGEVVWSFGALLIAHAHHPRMLDNGNILIYDNGNGRVVEYDIKGDVVFEYPVYAPIYGWCQKLSNGNYAFPDCFGGRMLEVTPNGEVVKQVRTGLIYQGKVYRK